MYANACKCKLTVHNNHREVYFAFKFCLFLYSSIIIWTDLYWHKALYCHSVLESLLAETTFAFTVLGSLVFAELTVTSVTLRCLICCTYWVCLCPSISISIINGFLTELRPLKWNTLRMYLEITVRHIFKKYKKVVC